MRNTGELQEEANKLTSLIHEKANKHLILKRKLSLYEKSIQKEAISENDNIEKLYEEASFLFNDTVKKTLEEAKNFHQSLVENRKLFLNTEIISLKNKILDIEKEMEESTEKRAQILQLIGTHGALDEFYCLQKNTLKKKVALEKIMVDLLNIEKVANQKNEIKQKEVELGIKIQRDFEISQQNRKEAISLFNENSRTLYNEPGNLIIDTETLGYTFNIETQRNESDGMKKMKIFCYDFALLELSKKKNGIDFLVHDSAIFDGVDSRQCARALEFAHAKTLEQGLQYIFAINSDMLPVTEFSKDFNIDDFICLRLGDKSPSDFLFGFQFEIKK